MRHVAPLLIILAAVILVSALLPRRLFLFERFENVVNTVGVGEVYKRTGLGSVSGCNTGDVKFNPTVDDLINSGFFKPEIVANLTKAERINRRVCPDRVELSAHAGASLQYAVDSSEVDCNVTIDGQPYELRSRAVTLLLDVVSSNEKALVVQSKNKDALNGMLDFMLSRPLFFVLDDSQPYNLASDYFVFSTYSVPNVTVLDKMPTESTTLTIRSSFDAGRVMPETQVKTITHKFHANRRQNSEARFVPFPLSFYYVSRAHKLGDSVVMMDKTSKRISSNANIAELLKGVMQGTVTNPCFNIQFRASFPSDVKRVHHLKEQITILSVASLHNDPTCSYEGRGIAAVTTRPEILRTMSIPAHSFVREVTTANAEWVCLDFLSVTKDKVSGDSICGHDKNTVSLWVPTKNKIDFIYAFTPTMKVVCATFFNTLLQKREVQFVQSYHCEDLVNDLVGAIQRLGRDLHLNVFENEVGIEVENLRLQYGVPNIREWYEERQLSAG